MAKDIAESSKGGLTFNLGAKPDRGVSGNIGSASGTYAVGDRSRRIVDTGKYLSVYRKKDGKLVYVPDTWNSDGPSVSPEAAAPEK